MSNIPPETDRVLPFPKIQSVIGPANYEPEAAPIDVGGGGPHPPGMDIGERLTRLEAGQDWIKVILTLIGAVVIGGFAFLGVQVNRLDAKFDAIGTRIDALGGRITVENAQTRQELVGIANAVANSITAARQVQPQIVIVPTPVPGAAPSAPTPPLKR